MSARHLVDRETLDHYRVALDSGRMHGPWTRATCAAVLRTLDAATWALDECRRERDEARGMVKLADEQKHRAIEFMADLDADPFLRYRDSITEVLRYASDKAGSGDHGVEIAGMASGLLRNLGVE